MFDRLFGRNKDNNQETGCAACGRTLLPGKWAETVVTDDGREDVICSLCVQAEVAVADAAPSFESTAPSQPAAPIPVSGRPQPTRQRPPGYDADDGDASWQAMQEKDAEIARIRSDLARAEAQIQDLAAQLAQLQRQLQGEAVTDWQAAPEETPVSQDVFASAVPLDHVPPPTTVDVVTEPIAMPPQSYDLALESPGLAPEVLTEPTREPEPVDALSLPAADQPPVSAQDHADCSDDEGDTAAIIAPAPLEPAAADEAAAAGPSWLFDAPPHQTFGGSSSRAAAESMSQLETSSEPPTPSPAEPTAQDAGPLTDSSFPDSDAPALTPEAASTPDTILAAGTAAAPESAKPPEELTESIPEPPPPSPEELAAEAAAHAMLQRGSDLLNVSGVPRKVAETSESLGTPMVYLACDDDVTMKAVFLWSMAWYEYAVDLNSGDVSLVERGYDDRAGLRPNAKVRADGTVQVAPLTTRRVGGTPTPPSGPTPPPPDDPDRSAMPGKADIISKSLKGQRTDDETGTWDHMAARDFDWGS